MQISMILPRQALNKAFLKVKPQRSEFDCFKKNLITLIDKANTKESEEFVKLALRDFLFDTYYKDKYEINVKGKIDLAIHNGKSHSDSVGVILEVKRPENKGEMVSLNKVNAKALHELILYYLRERIEKNNVELKHLIVTDVQQWFIFDANDFDKNIFRNTKIKSLYDSYSTDKKDTKFFYENVEQILPEIKEVFDCTYFDISTYSEPLHNTDLADDNKLISLYKILSPQHLLKTKFANDSNSLDSSFYTELLHIMGLTETKVGGKKIIERKKPGERNSASLMENAITQIDSVDMLTRVPDVEQFGDTHQDRLFGVALELTITWINRILFLKLLEAQLLKYHKNDLDYAFLRIEKVTNLDDLNTLFFGILAKLPAEREDEIKKLYEKVPYLNSSLFEPTALEYDALFISQLKDKSLPLLSTTVIKDKHGNRASGSLPILRYIFDFLQAYDFSSEGAEEIQEDNKTLINSSVLGLIFEKINGYKDGSFFTPGFITMYMCRETLRRAVVQKFNEVKKWNCQDLTDLHNKLDDSQEAIKDANEIVNSLKICDPAVGSGHFLVSALNEIIAIKSELKILVDKNNLRLKNHRLEVVNDELVVSDEVGKLFEYVPKNPESQRIQETLFHEKQTIIENCLFGVDINPNSVKICRLRLWIELLKNAYYKGPDYKELETLPNIDINIKCGNSLISRYALDADIKKALKKSKWTIDSYRVAVMAYRNAKSKEEKRDMVKLIDRIKDDFESEIAVNDKRLTRKIKLEAEVFAKTSDQMFEMTKPEKAKWDKALKTLTDEIQKIDSELEEIRSNKIYDNAFEWRFEFPEVLNDDGEFIGFDAVIGNPPYIRQEEIKEQKPYLKENYINYTGASDLYVFFVEKGLLLLKKDGEFSYIMPNKWMQADYGKPLRQYIIENRLRQIIDFGDLQVFDEATTYPCIINISKSLPSEQIKTISVKTLKFDFGFEEYVYSNIMKIATNSLNDSTWVISSVIDNSLISKLKANNLTLQEFLGQKSYRGVLTGLSEAFIIDEETKLRLINEDKKSAELIQPFLLGRNISPYAIPIVKQYLILIPKGFTIKNSIKPNSFMIKEPMPRYGNMPDDDAWDWFKSNYSAIANHLLKFKAKAQNRTDQGDFWWELRACDYYSEFKKPKIMYQKFQVKPCFIYDINGLFCNDSMWIIPNTDKSLLGILNSKIVWWLISKYCTAIQNGYQLIWNYFGQIPIPKTTVQQSKPIVKLVDQILTLKQADPKADTRELEREIDQLVYALYGLTDDEIKIVEGE